MQEQYYTGYEEPIRMMQRLSKEGISFSLTFMKMNGNVAHIDKAILRSMSLHGKNANHRLQYTNTSTEEHRSLFIPLLMAVNGRKIRLSI